MNTFQNRFVIWLVFLPVSFVFGAFGVSVWTTIQYIIYKDELESMRKSRGKAKLIRQLKEKEMKQKSIQIHDKEIRRIKREIKNERKKYNEKLYKGNK